MQKYIPENLVYKKFYYIGYIIFLLFLLFSQLNMVGGVDSKLGVYLGEIYLGEIHETTLRVNLKRTWTLF